jgi:hypothetical protein
MTPRSVEPRHTTGNHAGPHMTPGPRPPASRRPQHGAVFGNRSPLGSATTFSRSSGVSASRRVTRLGGGAPSHVLSPCRRRGNAAGAAVRTGRTDAAWDLTGPRCARAPMGCWPGVDEARRSPGRSRPSGA